MNRPSPDDAGQDSQKMMSFLGLQPQSLLQSVLDRVGVALAVFDRERRFVFTNQAAFDMFGAAENLPIAEWRRHYKFHDSQGREIPEGQAPIMRAFAGEEVEPHDVRPNMVVIPARPKTFVCIVQIQDLIGDVI